MKLKTYWRRTKVGGRYTDAVRQCCQSSLALNVGIMNIGPVIRCVLETIGNRHAGELPSVGLLSSMLVELKAVSSFQLAEELAEVGEGVNTLHSDGTSKFGRKYVSYQVATGKRTFSLRMVEMKSGTAEQTLEMLKRVVGEVSEMAGKMGMHDVGKKILK